MTFIGTDIVGVSRIRKMLDEINCSALLAVDCIASLACDKFEMDEWGVDIAISGSQKGLMLPPGLSFNAISEKAINVSNKSTFKKSYWDWNEHLEFNKTGFFHTLPLQICCLDSKKLLICFMKRDLLMFLKDMQGIQKLLE